MKKAILFGCNYATDSRARLRGCINDVNNMGKFLGEHGYAVHIFTDEDVNDQNTTAKGILRHIREVCDQSNTETLSHVWIHFSGHGCQQKDWSGDETDGKDECIVPSDYAVSGLVTDDQLHQALSRMNPKTYVTLVFDCCHSGSMCDLKYNYTYRGHQLRLFQNNRTTRPLRCNTLMISGCMDNQTSADAYNVAGNRQFTGAMTSSLLQVLRTNHTRHIHSLFANLHRLLLSKRFTQKPQLSTSVPLKDSSIWSF